MILNINVSVHANSIFCRDITKLQEQNVDKINKERQVTGEKRWVNILEQMVSVAKQTQI